MTTNYNRQQSILHKQARFERYFWISLFSITCTVVLIALAGCGGSDGNDTQKDPTVSVCDENDPNFVGPCELNPPPGH